MVTDSELQAIRRASSLSEELLDTLSSLSITRVLKMDSATMNLVGADLGYLQFSLQKLRTFTIRTVSSSNSRQPLEIIFGGSSPKRKKSKSSKSKKSLKLGSMKISACPSLLTLLSEFPDLASKHGTINLCGTFSIRKRSIYLHSYLCTTLDLECLDPTSVTQLQQSDTTKFDTEIQEKLRETIQNDLIDPLRGFLSSESSKLWKSTFESVKQSIDSDNYL